MERWDRGLSRPVAEMVDDKDISMVVITSSLLSVYNGYDMVIIVVMIVVYKWSIMINIVLSMIRYDFCCHCSCAPRIAWLLCVMVSVNMFLYIIISKQISNKNLKKKIELISN